NSHGRASGCIPRLIARKRTRTSCRTQERSVSSRQEDHSFNHSCNFQRDIPMKKSLLLLSALAASATALAQSSVSVTGTVDLYAQRANGSLTSRSMLSSGGNQTSKLYFRGTEDLGGGLTAGFWLEAGLSLDTGLGNATNT